MPDACRTLMANIAMLRLYVSSWNFLNCNRVFWAKIVIGPTQHWRGSILFLAELNQGTAVYYLPVGSALPNSSSPNAKFQCTSCNSKTLALYANYSTVQNEPITSVWRQALTLINATCGSTYLQQSGITFKSTASSSSHFYFALYTASFMFIASMFL